MADGKEFVDGILQHFASEFYDPVKAHEYYLKTRELQDKKPQVSQLKGKAKKETWAVTKSNIDKVKATELKQIAGSHTAETQRLHQSAQAKRAEIQTSMKKIFDSLRAGGKARVESATTTSDAFLERLSAQRTAKMEKIAADAKSKLDSLPPLPKGSSDADKLKRREEIAKIRGDAKSKGDFLNEIIDAQVTDIKGALDNQRQAISDQTTAVSNSLSQASKANVQKVVSELKASVDKAQKNYVGLKQQTVAKYDATAKAQFDAIKQDTSP